MFMCIQYVLNVCARTSCKTNPMEAARWLSIGPRVRLRLPFSLAPLPIVTLHPFRAELSHSPLQTTSQKACRRGSLLLTKCTGPVKQEEKCAATIDYLTVCGTWQQCTSDTINICTTKLFASYSLQSDTVKPSCPTTPGC
ncbi:nephrocystin-1 [Platysternon megacephalum]|uniref:Nephrocystin-1 n=1 Tax=Platysternon megacephalum TaxID=55544 RepID=A0A4D9DRY5_9SAUR|nr:nephrocystin-1 [Platysternon megacephalum]